MATDLDTLAAALAGGHVAVLTGAGLSTESGIPDYRGPDGRRRVAPMQYGEFVGSAAARRRYWARAYVGWPRFRAARPNAGHRVVAALQAAGLTGPPITQNVDSLHQRAGSHAVLELHGTLAVVRCLTCEDRTPRDRLQDRLAAANPGFAEAVAAREPLQAPGPAEHGESVNTVQPQQAVDDDGPWRPIVRPDGDVALPSEAIEGFRLVACERCGGDLLKPDVVYFGESVPRERAQEAYDRVDASRLLLVLGSSLQVMSGYRFVRHAARHGIPVAIITRGPTRATAEEVTYRVDAGLGAALSTLAGALGLPPDGLSRNGYDALAGAADGVPLGLI